MVFPVRIPMANHLKMPKKQQVLALLALGWSYRRIEAETGVRRETVSRYDQARQANAAKTFPGPDTPPASEGPDHSATGPPNAATAFPGSPSNPAKTFPGSRRFTAGRYRDAILEKRVFTDLSTRCDRSRSASSLVRI